MGLRGAKVTAEKLRPRLAICLEGTPADDGFTPAGEAQGVLGAGVQIRHRDGSMVAHPGFVEFARTVAQKEGIPHQLAVRTGGGTNGGSIHLAPGGVPTLVLGIPVRYAHTHYGYSAAADYDAALALAGALLRALTPQVVDAAVPCCGALKRGGILPRFQDNLTQKRGPAGPLFIFATTETRCCHAVFRAQTYTLKLTAVSPSKSLPNS